MKKEQLEVEFLKPNIYQMKIEFVDQDFSFIGNFEYNSHYSLYFNDILRYSKKFDINLDKSQSNNLYSKKILQNINRLVHSFEDSGDFRVIRRFRGFRGDHRHHRQLVVEVVEYDDILIQDVQQVWGIVLLQRLVFHGDILEVAHSVERGIAVESANLLVLTLHLYAVYQCVDGLV